MKRKPDVMVAVIALFFIGLIVSGFSSAFTDSNNVSLNTRHNSSVETRVEYSASRY